MRTFISLNPDLQTLAQISQIQKDVMVGVSEIDERFPLSIKWEKEDKFHITLFFIGDVNEEKINKIDSVLTNMQDKATSGELKFRASGINAFPNLRYPRVLILELLNEDSKVFELSNAINICLMNIDLINDKSFYPHITLGRIKREKKINLTKLEREIKNGLNFSVRSFHLMKSELSREGSSYESIKEYNL